ncbi:RidA family protein [Hyphococcus luteus]|uniref:Reactive intermediate/imine deaminase n=1 Tax=Hyphococcus luteus TaxID=2058213 RepID=A0A2S7K3I9_9PROT|nr:Rid family hydrolase [Marinicaulis flavus]PQA87057.1 reactive intermediate/imine deaminase [Marinicaulis flavus]
MGRSVESFTLPDLMKPIGPYSHYTKAGDFISISAIAGVDPETGALAGDDVESQTAQILEAINTILEDAGSDFEHVLHINIFLTDMALFDRMNAVYADILGEHHPARSVFEAAALPKDGALLTMNATAVEKP